MTTQRHVVQFIVRLVVLQRLLGNTMVNRRRPPSVVGLAHQASGFVHLNDPCE